MGGRLLEAHSYVDRKNACRQHQWILHTLLDRGLDGGVRAPPPRTYSLLLVLTGVPRLEMTGALRGPSSQGAGDAVASDAGESGVGEGKKGVAVALNRGKAARASVRAWWHGLLS